VTEVLRFEWLPLQGRDFVVRYDYASANGVVIESEVFYAAPDLTPEIAPSGVLDACSDPGIGSGGPG
jgi:hypothetical protein